MVEIRIECNGDVSQSTLEEFFEQEMRQRLLKDFKNLKYAHIYFPDGMLDPYASDPYKEHDLTYNFWAEEIKQSEK